MIIEGCGTLNFDDEYRKEALIRREKFSKSPLLGKIAELFVRIFFPPLHEEKTFFGSSIEECLEKIRKAIVLPEGDLRPSPRTMRFGTFFGPEGVRHHFDSRIGDERRANESGYIEVSVIEFPVASAGVLAGKKVFKGSVHAVTNCRGMFVGGRCIGCGYQSHS
ncbi:MAG: hypothetical protein AAB495_01180 [Patescibacteria group bacterium]